ncbi:hypothetical protein BHE74_00059682 [Ensete ventricosum]|nr:hypothetical protein BHE74_00059682 [Ensete ventricosum]
MTRLVSTPSLMASISTCLKIEFDVSLNSFVFWQLLALVKALAHGAAAGPSKAETVDRVAEVLQLLEEAFAECSHGKDYFGGDTIGYVDIVLGSCLGWMKTVEEMKDVRLLDEKKVPLLVGWAESFLQDKAVKQVMPEIDEYVQYAKMISASAR